MKRREAFQKLTAFGAMTAFVPFLKAATDKDLEKVKILKPEKEHKIAVDVQALHNVGPSGGKMFTAKEILELYFATGVFLCQRTPEMGPNYQPVVAIET